MTRSPTAQRPATAPELIVLSGGQTGADRAALDWAIANHLPHGGWCPKFRLAEDGCVPMIYQLQEMPTPSYADRTQQNVIDSDGTLIISMSPQLVGGSKLTFDFAREHQKPALHISRNDLFPGELAAEFVRRWRIKRLNIAGPRVSTEPEIGSLVWRVLDEMREILTRRPARN